MARINLAEVNLAEAQKEQIEDSGVDPNVWQQANDLKLIKIQLKNLKKDEDRLVASIKKYMTDNNLTNISSIGLEVSLNERKSVSFDQENLITWAKENGHSDIVKVVEVIDEVELEKQVYNGFILPKDLEPYQLVKITKVLNVK